MEVSFLFSVHNMCDFMFLPEMNKFMRKKIAINEHLLGLPNWLFAHYIS